MAFRGCHSLNLDDKGRLAIPARIRKLFADASPDTANQVIITRSDTDRCLWLYPLAEWLPIEKAIMDLPGTNTRNRVLQQKLIGNAIDLELDGSSRVLLPAKLRAFAGLQKQVAMVGLGRKFEIWDEPTWDKHTEMLEENSVEESNMPSVEYEQIRF